MKPITVSGVWLSAGRHGGPEAPWFVNLRGVIEQGPKPTIGRKVVITLTQGEARQLAASIDNLLDAQVGR